MHLQVDGYLLALSSVDVKNKLEAANDVGVPCSFLKSADNYSLEHACPGVFHLELSDVVQKRTEEH